MKIRLTLERIDKPFWMTVTNLVIMWVFAMATVIVINMAAQSDWTLRAVFTVLAFVGIHIIAKERFQMSARRDTYLTYEDIQMLKTKLRETHATDTEGVGMEFQDQ